MMAELGQFSLVLALIMAIAQAFFPLVGAHKGHVLWMTAARPFAQLQAGLLILAFASLVYCFVENDFSVKYVAHGSNAHLPLYYRVAAVWGAHEGSMLLWATILGLWTLAVASLSQGLVPDMRARVLGVMGLVSMGVLSFILLTSNPFERLVPAAVEGNDLNPLLQDFGMTIHPPMLYMGYVGLSVAFSFAIAALLGGQLDTAWARWSRPWTLVAWIFLTFGITLGSWWAYYELGWGGWWFWDPVENASFMPWLVATALIHSLAVTEKRGAFKVWTVLLAIFAFSLSLLGTFLVRSGVLTSVHAFASDPARGLFILILLMVVVGGSLLLYGIRAPSIRDHAHYEWFSRENLLLLNNILLVTASASILLGTLYPLVLDALSLGKISVGSPYFATVFAPLMAPVFLLAGLAPMVNWRRGSLNHHLRSLGWVAGFSLFTGIGATLLYLDAGDYAAMAGLSMALWLVGSLGLSLSERITMLSRAGKGLLAIGGSFTGMLLAHTGAAVFLVGVVISNHYSVEKNVLMKVSDSVDIAGYAFRFEGVSTVDGPNFQAREGHFRVFHGDHEVAALYPQKRVYQVQRNPMTEAAIDAGIFRDLYVALGENVADQDWTVRLYYKPFMRWVWLGGVMMVMGGLAAVADRHYRFRSTL